MIDRNSHKYKMAIKYLKSQTEFERKTGYYYHLQQFCKEENLNYIEFKKYLKKNDRTIIIENNIEFIKDINENIEKETKILSNNKNKKLEKKEGTR